MTSYRLDIQGLRAVAVIAVIAYHYRVGLDGGYLGVDVFFVISGFVVGGLLERELRTTGRVNFMSFLKRRFLRLIPALSVMVTTVVLLQTLFFLNAETRGVSASTGIASLLGISNFWIADQTGGYFGERAERNPLLHTWSLSAEWQFYFLIFLVFLLFSLLRERSRRVSLVATLGGLSLFSFFLIFNQSQIGFFEIGGFYSPFARFWEFIAGVLLVFVRKPERLSPRLIMFLEAIAFAALISSLFFLSYLFTTPGPTTLIPVLASAWLVFSGGLPGSLLGRVLSVRPMVWLGDLSYSLYLWHWPIYVMWIQFGLTPYPESWYLVALILGTLVAAWTSKRLVEDPFRKLTQSDFNRKLRVGLGVLGATAMINGLAVGWDARLKEQTVWTSEIKDGDVGKTQFEDFLLTTFFPCTDSSDGHSTPRRGFWLKCLQSRPDSQHSVAVIGDSHAQHLFVGIAENLPGENVIFLVDDALPVRGVNDLVESHLQYVAQSETIHTVFISSYWSRRGVPIGELGDTVRSFQESGKEVFLTDGTPVARDDIGSCKWPRHVFAEPEVKDCHSGSGSRSREEIVDDLLSLSEQTGVGLIETYDLFCSDGQCSVASNDQSTIFYRDRDHLNIPGSRLVGAAVASVVR